MAARTRFRPTSLASAAAAELFGTFMLVFAGTATVVALAQQAAGAPLDPTPVALVHGFTVLIVVYAFGHVSGAHINPAVTLGLTAAGRFPVRTVPVYVFAQLAGGVLASLVVWALFGDAAREEPILLGATAPGEGVGAGTVVLAELVITMILLVVISATATDERAQKPAVGLGVGLTIAAGVFATLSISGGSFNPVRSLAPMLVAGAFPAWLAYIAGPVLGGAIGALVYDLVLRPGAPPTEEGAVEEQPKTATGG